MTGEEMLFERILSKNQSVLDDLNVQLYLSDLEFTYPAIRDGGDEYNTVVVGEAVRGMTIGTQTYRYIRTDIQQAFIDLGYNEVTVNVPRDQVNEVTVLQALKVKHNLSLKNVDIKSFEFVGDVATLEVKPTNYAYTGVLRVAITQESLLLAEQFPNNVLDGLYIEKDLSTAAPVTQLLGFQAEG